MYILCIGDNVGLYHHARVREGKRRCLRLAQFSTNIWFGTIVRRQLNEVEGDITLCPGRAPALNHRRKKFPILKCAPDVVFALIPEDAAQRKGNYGLNQLLEKDTGSDAVVR